MAILNLQNLSLKFGGPLIFDNVTLSIEKGEKVALIGRNGTGKSTLLKLLEGTIKPDLGEIIIQKGAKLAFLSQEVPTDIKDSVFDVVASGLKGEYDLIKKYHDLSKRLENDSSPALTEEFSEVHSQLDAKGAWELQGQVDKIISELYLPENSLFNELSAGLKRQVLLGKALASGPDILLLDEPTNHMDIDSIKRLENFLIRFTVTIVFVTHDRMFLKKIANRIIEIDRGTIFSQTCNYDTFLERRLATLESEDVTNALFDKKLADEEKWIRQGIKARRTRNEGRVKKLKRMRTDRQERREQTGNVKFKVEGAKGSGKIVAKVENIFFSYDDNPVIKDLTATILKGDCVGILGANGAGKTTLLNILLGKLEPSKGKVKTGTGLEVAYFDQMREQLNEEKSVRDNVSDGNDFLTINGRSTHVIGYLKNFLFSPHEAQAPVSKLSGGERNRLLLAKLFTKPSNLLVLDEPTNDLDAETLELLEEVIEKYTGTVLMVSHDREFINNIVTSTIAFEGNGKVKEYVGGYDDWIEQRKTESSKKDTVPTSEGNYKEEKKKKVIFGFNQKRELKNIPGEIEKMEAEQETLCKEMSATDFFKKDKDFIKKKNERLDILKNDLKRHYERWEELEKLK